MNKQQHHQPTSGTVHHKPHKSIELEQEAPLGLGKKHSGYKYGSMIGKGIGNIQGHSFHQPSTRLTDNQHHPKLSRDLSKKESRLTKYFMNKLAKSKSIADIGQQGLTKLKINTIEDASQSQYASTARDDGRAKPGANGEIAAGKPGPEIANADPKDLTTADVQPEQQNQRERSLIKSSSLTKNWGAHRFNATSSYIKAKQRAQNLSLGFDQVKGLRNRSFLGKSQHQQRLGDDAIASAGQKRKPLYLQAQHLKRNDPSYIRDTSNPKNLSINSRLLNPRPLNNLSKNMSIREDQDMYHAELAQMQTEVIKERGLDGSQYDNVSMGSIGSFQADQAHPKDGGDKKTLVPVYNNSSPGKQRHAPLGSLKHQGQGNWESNFHTQGTENHKSSTKKLEVNTSSKSMLRGNNIGTIKRTPLTSKYSQAPKMSKHKKQSTSEFEFIRKVPKDQHDVAAKMSSISPLKFERASYLVKNRLISSGKFSQTQPDPSKLWKTHRASQQVAAAGPTTAHPKNPSSQQPGALNAGKDVDAEGKQPAGEPVQLASASHTQKSTYRNYEELAAAKQEADNANDSAGATHTFSNLPIGKRNNRHLVRTKNLEQTQPVPKLFSPTLQADETRGQKILKQSKIQSPGTAAMSPLTPVQASKRGPGGDIGFAATQSLPMSKIKGYTGQNNKKALRENKSVKNVLASAAAGGPKEHKRSMTLATRDALADQVGDAFQSIIEEPAEDQNRSIENKSKEGNRVRDSKSQIPHLAKNGSRGQGQYNLESSKLGNRGASQAKEADQSATRSNIRDHKQSMKIPRGSMNIKTDHGSSKANLQVQQQYGLLAPSHGNSNSLKGGQVTAGDQLAQPNAKSQSKIEKADSTSRNNSQVPQNTRQRSFLRTTRNTIAQHAPKSSISIPDQLSMSQRYVQYQNSNNSRKAVDRNLTFLQEFKKSNQIGNKQYADITKPSQSRPISTSKPSTISMTAKGVPHLPLGSKLNYKAYAQESEGDPTTHSARRNQKNTSKERQQSITDATKKQSGYKKSLTSKKSINTQSKIDLLDKGPNGKVAQINNLMIEQQLPVTTRNEYQKQQKSDLVESQQIEKQYPTTAGQSSEGTATKVGSGHQAGPLGKNLHQSNTNPQQPSSSLSGMLISKSQLTTSRSPRKDELSAEPKIPEFPLSAEEALTHYSTYLNEFEKQEIHDYSKKIYYMGQNCKNKVKGHVIKMVPNTAPQQKSKLAKDRRSSTMSAGNNSSSWQQMIPSQRQIERLQQMDIHNYGYDDENGDYRTVLKDHIGYRYEVLQALGSGSFGQALKCLDHSNGSEVAIKIIRNKKKFQYQAGMELKILLYLNKHDKQDQNNVIRVKDFMLFREHLIIAFELLSINLYEFIKNNNFQGVSQNLIRRFAIQILQALKYHHDYSLVHCDMKPENILLKQENKSGIKVIDYGSSCFMGQRIYTYIQSRFYRAPEIILGIPYTTAIDMWSFGAIVAELYTGFPLFPGESEMEQLAYIMELYGVPPENVLSLATRCDIFFTSDLVPKLQPNSRGKIRYPNQKKLEDVLRCSDESFLDFLNQCFVWDPVKRMTALEALQHPWILEGLPEKVLKHHKKMFGYKDDKAKMRQLTLTDIQGFPKDKKDQSIHDILREIREEQEREKQILLAKSRLESSRNNLTRQTYKTSDREKTSRAEDSENVRSQKSLRSQLNTQGQPASLEVAEIHMHMNKMAQTQLIKLPSNYKSTNQSPNKERKSRKQRMENSELKLVNKLSQFHNYDNDAEEQQQQTHEPLSSMKSSSTKRKSTSIKVYKPEQDDYAYSDMDQHYMSKLAALKAQFEQESKKLDQIEEKMTTLEADNSTSHVRDEDQTNRHVNAIQTNILSNKQQVTQQIADHSDYQKSSPYTQTLANSQSYNQSQSNLSKASQHYKPKRRSQHKPVAQQTEIQAHFDKQNRYQHYQQEQQPIQDSHMINPISMVYSNNRQYNDELDHQNGYNQQASSKHALVVQSAGLSNANHDDVDSAQDLTPQQYKYRQ